jgi:hypothetical protein
MKKKKKLCDFEFVLLHIEADLERKREGRIEKK